MEYILLKNDKSYCPRTPILVDDNNLMHYLTKCKHTEIAVDIETTGLNAITDTITHIGWADESGCYCADFNKLSQDNINNLYSWLSSKKVTYFNAVFDHAFLTHVMNNQEPELSGDTFIFFSLLANEGYDGQSRSLDIAIESILHWDSNNKRILEDALARNNLTKNTMYKLRDFEPILYSEYCALDAEACYQLDRYFREFCYNEGLDSVVELHDNDYCNLVELVVEQQLRGIAIDKEALTMYQTGLVYRMQHRMDWFRGTEKVKAFLELYEHPESIETTKVVKTKKIWAKLSDEPWVNDDKWLRDFDKKPTSKWQEEHGCWYQDIDTISLKHTKVKGVTFNANSKPALRKLFFDHLGYEVIEQTETGLAKIDKNTLPKLGNEGALLNEYNLINKTLGYVKRIDEISDTGILHAGLRILRTKTGRSAGTGGFNMQQLSKEKGLLSCFVAREGYNLVDTDFTSLENVVLAEGSRDPGLWELYATGKPHDSYLWVAAQMFPNEGIQSLYNLKDPSATLVAEAKKKFKRLRTISKVIVLSSNYGAGAFKIWQTLVNSGIDIELEEVKELRSGYWDIFAGIRDFEDKLMREKQLRGGWILNGMGRPICIPDEYDKDIVNRWCQSTGVGILHRYLLHLNNIRKERRISMYPWMVDIHDQTIWEVKKEHTESARNAYEDAYARLNEDLQPDIELKGDIEVGSTLWKFKS